MSFSGGLRPDMVQLWCICTINFLIFPVFCLLRPGVEPTETIFKGAQIVHFTLGLAGFYHYMRWYHVRGSGCSPALSLLYSSSEVPEWMTFILNGAPLAHDAFSDPDS